ncbi:hypothetical protein DH2020_005388 [Rehmannia glutinosa]|uniref:Replication factor A C-terminal domain-containing protein n=1 Tax=Rehmannia glutinosa TaxID=99300 RepID=A0ABR0XFW3_REHGL
MPPLFSLIKDINPSKWFWALKLRLIRIYKFPGFGSSSSSPSLECVFHDRETFDILANMDGVDESMLIDVIGKLSAKNDPENKVIMGRPTKLMDIILEDHELIHNGNTSTPISNISSATSKSIVEEFQGEKDLIRTIEEIVEGQEAGNYWVFATIVSVETGSNWWYLACWRCAKKIDAVGGEFYCEKCKRYDKSGNIRYKIHVRVIDTTGNVVFLMWDKECTELIGKTAFDLRATTEENGIPTEIENLVDIKVLFKIQIKSGQIGIHNPYPVRKLTTDDSIISKYCGLPFDTQESDMFSKLKSSELDVGDEFCSYEDDATTPLNGKKPLISKEDVIDSNLKRSLIDEFSSTAKDKTLKIELKKEKE